MRTQGLMCVFVAAFWVLCTPSFVSAYGGGGNDGGSNDGASGTGGAMGSSMDQHVVGYFFGVPIYFTPVPPTTVKRPDRDIPTLSAMTEEQWQQWQWDRLQESIKHAEAAGHNVTKWQVINGGAQVIVWTGKGAQMVLNFLPGVGWGTNAALSAFTSATDSASKGNSAGEVVFDAAVGGTISALTSKFGPGKNADRTLKNARNLKNIAFGNTVSPARGIKAWNMMAGQYSRYQAQNAANVGVEEAANQLASRVKNQVKQQQLQSYHRPEAVGGYAMPAAK